MALTYFYSPSTGGFYIEAIHGKNMPGDVIGITNELYAEIMDGQNSGMVIMPPDADHASPWLGYPLPPTPEEEAAAMQKAITAAIQQRLDAFAQTKGYDSILSAASYAASTNPRFQAEGRCAVIVRDAAWATGHELLNAVLAGTRPMPTAEETVAALPEPAWPDEAA